MPSQFDLSPQTPPARPFTGLLGAYAAFFLTLIAVVSLAGWSAYVDFQESRVSELRAEVNRLRSHAVRTIALIQEKASNHEGNGLAWLGSEDWLREHWDLYIPTDPSRAYGAVIDNDGNIVVHYLRELEGRRLPVDWYDFHVPEAGDDVVQTANPAVTSGGRSLDIGLPILLGEHQVGTYHSGFNLDWFESKVAARQVETRNRWITVFSLISIVLVMEGVSLVRIARRLSSLQADVAMGHVRRLAELGQVAGGIAHEIRNPLNAVRLNLHVVRKLWTGGAANVDRVDGIMKETVFEIERVDGLLRSLLEYARPEKALTETVNLVDEISSVAGLLQPLLQRDRIRLDLDMPDTPVDARIDRGRFRQIALNLMKNAVEAVVSDGRIYVRLTSDDQNISLFIADEGPGIEPNQREKIFDPFFTTKELGTGLGLTLVRRFVEEAGGTIRYMPGSPVGSIFVVMLPRLVRNQSEVSTSAVAEV